MKTLMKTVLAASALSFSMGCDKPVESFSLLAASSTFKQSVAYQQREVDILWVVDSSGSMQSSQTNLANNFNQFIQEFQTKGFDFHMAVTDTGAYLDSHYGTWTRSRFKTGSGGQNSGVYVMTNSTPNLVNVFKTNIRTGITGTGDERAFSSFKKALENPNNTGFRRPGAFLSIIIVSDEDDFSHYDWQNGTNSYYFTEDFNDPNMFSIDYFTNFLMTYTQSTAQTARDNFAVHSISIKDTTCLQQLNDNAQKISVRQQQLAEATGGVNASLCAPMSEVLEELSRKTVELASVFQLNREPWPTSIQVMVNGATVQQSTTCGWSYSDQGNAWVIRFHGSACIPPASADVRIFFEPKYPQY